MGFSTDPNFDHFEIVQIGFISTDSDGSPISWTKKAHNLGYAPIPYGILNNASVSPIFSNGNVPLPTYGSLTIDSTNDTIIWESYMDILADDTYVYFVLFNATNAPIASLTSKYYLMRERAN